jgi:hypothetical protein
MPAETATTGNSLPHCPIFSDRSFIKYCGIIQQTILLVQKRYGTVDVILGASAMRSIRSYLPFGSDADRGIADFFQDKAIRLCPNLQMSFFFISSRRYYFLFGRSLDPELLKWE